MGSDRATHQFPLSVSEARVLHGSASLPPPSIHDALDLKSIHCPYCLGDVLTYFKFSQHLLVRTHTEPREQCTEGERWPGNEGASRTEPSARSCGPGLQASGVGSEAVLTQPPGNQ